jgi:hypothetical protein
MKIGQDEVSLCLTQFIGRIDSRLNSIIYDLHPSMVPEILDYGGPKMPDYIRQYLSYVLIQGGFVCGKQFDSEDDPDLRLTLYNKLMSVYLDTDREKRLFTMLFGFYINSNLTERDEAAV